MILSDKAMLVVLSISRWTARKYDRKATQEVASQHGARGDAGRYNKILIARCALAEIDSADSAARAYHYEHTLPWRNDGARILPVANYLEYTEKMRELRERFEKGVVAFEATYAQYVEEARTRLGSLFNAEDYPSVASIRGKYAFGVQIDPLPVANDFRAGLSKSAVEAIKADIEARNAVAVKNAMRDAWDRLYKVVSNLAEKLSDDTAIFRDSLIGNVKDVVDILPSLNLTDDPELARMTDAIRRNFASLDPESLRKSKTHRKVVANDSKAILGKLKGYIGE